MKIVRTSLTQRAVASLLMTFALGACGRHHAEGPGERAGKKIDRTIEKLEDSDEKHGRK